MNAPNGHDAAFRAMLESLVRLIEHHSPSMRCSILLLDADGVTLREGAAPRLPAHYNAAIDGLRIGLGVGSCGTAAYTRTTTIVADIATHEYWAGFRDLALPAGLRACWSTPIIGTQGDVLGTFAMYYDEPREPSSEDLEVIETAASLASALIERERLICATQELNDELQSSTVELEMLNEQLHESAGELEMQKEELEVANEDLREREEALDAANRAKADFLATMSHELRTPLNAVGGYADLLLSGIRGELTEPQRIDIERMKRSGQHLLGLINDILNYAKLDAGRVEYRLEQVRTRDLLIGLEELVRPQVDAKSLAFSVLSPAGDVLAMADAEKTRQVLLNLVTNAVKFTEPGGAITVECDESGGAVQIRVRDTGRGIPAAEVTRIFDPFVQVNRDAIPSSQRGVGLGLAISRDLAVGMGGSLSVESEEGRGSIFTLSLPRALADASQPALAGPRDSGPGDGAGAVDLGLLLSEDGNPGLGSVQG